MPTAVVETIAQEVVARLQEITTANSYNFNVSSVDRPSRNAKGWRPRHLGIVVDQKPSEANSAMDHPGSPPAIAFDVTFDITGFILKTDELSTTSDADVTDMEFAIRNAIADTSTWHNFDGNAVIANWADSTLIEDSDYAGVTVSLVVTYRVSETDPYTARA